MNKMVLHIITICTLLLFSCSKDKDEIKPIITINSPVNMQQINGRDTLQILGTITDDKNIEVVTISLRDDQNNQVLSTLTRSPEKKDATIFNLNVLFFFDNIHMPAGQYNFKITADDGENITTIFIPINFKESLKLREGIFVIGNSDNFSSIYFLENNFTSTFFKSINGDFIGAALDSYNQQLINVAKTTGSISATTLSIGNELWSVPVLGNPPTPFYSGFYFDNQNIYLGKRNGNVQGYDRNGNPNFSTGTSTNYFMESAFIHDEQYFVMEEQAIVVGAAGSISLTWLYSGVRVQQTAINVDVKGIYSSTANTIILLANDASLNAKVLFYDIPSGGISTPFNVASLGKIDASVEISNGVYLVAANDNLTAVNINNFSTLGYLSGVPVDKIWYDNLTGELYVANGSLLSIYDYSDRTLKGSYTHTEAIEEVLFWYNK